MQGALHLFTLGTIPVYANLWFGLILGFLAMNSPAGLGYKLGIIAAWTVTILIHEFGHALVARRYGLNPQILLHGIGGLCFYTPVSSDRKNALITAAGPALQIGFGLIIWGLVQVLESAAPEVLWQPIGNGRARHTALMYMFDQTVFLSIVWGALNLIPLHPLDGGHLFRLFMQRKQRPVQAERMTYQVSIGVAVVAAIAGFASGWTFPGIMAGYLGYINFEALNALGMSHPVRKKNVFADALVKEAEAAFAGGDWYEAARLAHQVRDQANVPERAQKRAFEIITLANVELQDWEEAAGFVDHAADTPAIREARAKIEAGLEADKAEGW